MIPTITTQLGGYVRVTATLPVFAFELFGSSNSLTFLANVAAQGVELQPQTSSQTVVASNGAIVFSMDGSTSIAIPPGALTADTAITLQAPAAAPPAPSNNQTVVAAVEALPSGTQFAIPVPLTFPLAVQLTPGTTIDLLIFNPATDAFTDSGFIATVDDSGTNRDRACYPLHHVYIVDEFERLDPGYRHLLCPERREIP